MFRKRKESESGSGINRISRLIEQRQREAGDEPSDEDLLNADDTIMMPRGQTAEPETDDDAVGSVSLLGIRSAAPAEPSQPEPQTAMLAESEQPDEQASQPPAEQPAYEPPSAFAQQAYGAQATPAWEAEPEPEPEPQQSYAMPVPNIGAASARGTLVAADAEWEGKLIAQGDVRIEGVLRGEIETSGTLVVAPQAQVHGIIRAREIVLGGDVEGEVSCEQRLEILPGGSARGQINSGTLVVHEGAYIDSRFQMRRAEAGASGA